MVTNCICYPMDFFPPSNLNAGARVTFDWSIIFLLFLRINHPVSSRTVRRGREESRRPRPDAAVLRPPSRKSGMRRHPRPARLPFGFRRRVAADRDAAQPQRQQQQRTVRDEPQHQHHVDPERCAVNPSVSQCHDTVTSFPAFSRFHTRSTYPPRRHSR